MKPPGCQLQSCDEDFARLELATPLELQHVFQAAPSPDRDPGGAWWPGQAPRSVLQGQPNIHMGMRLLALHLEIIWAVVCRVSGCFLDFLEEPRPHPEHLGC